MAIQDFIIGKVLKVVAKKLDGYKTKIGGGGKIAVGVGTFCTGLAAVVKNMFPDLQQLPDMDLKAAFATIAVGVATISAGISDIGLGGKAEKQKAATIQQTTVIRKQNVLIAEQNNLLAKGTVTGENGTLPSSSEVSRIFPEKKSDPGHIEDQRPGNG